MNRRTFLTRATAAAVGALVLDPERLLWTPGARTFFDIRTPLQAGDLVYFDTATGAFMTPDGRLFVQATDARRATPLGHGQVGIIVNPRAFGADPTRLGPGSLVQVSGPATVPVTVYTDYLTRPR